MNTNCWFKLIKIDNDTYAIKEDSHSEETNSYLLLDETKALLIDTGMGVENIFDVINEKNLLLFHYLIAINNGKSVPTFTFNDLKKICLKDSKDTSEIQEETKQFEKFESEKELKKAFDYLKSLGFFFKVEKGEYMTDLTFDIVFETIVEIVKQVQDDETDSIKTC